MRENKIQTLKGIAVLLLSIVFLTLFISLSVTEIVAAQRVPQILKGNSDGLYAELEATESENATDIVITLNNKGRNEFVDITADITVPEGFELLKSDIGTLPLSSGGEMTMTYSIGIRFHEIESEQLSDTSPGTEDGKNSLPTYIIIVAAAIVAVVLVVVLILKGKRSHMACILLMAMLAGSFTFLMPLKAEAAGELLGGKINLCCSIESEGEKLPVYITIIYKYTVPQVEPADGMGSFEITYYYGPQGIEVVQEENIKNIAECGFTAIPVEGGDARINKKALELLRKYGLKCSALRDNRIREAIELARSERGEAQADNLVKTIVKDYDEYMDVIDGWWLMDEPSAATFSALGKVTAAFKKYNPENISLVNLYPDYATSKQLGKDTYQEYLDSFIELGAPSFISYDHYHFKNGGARKGFFTNMESIRTTSMANDLEYMLIISLTQHYNYDNLSYDQIEWEVNMCLTYGMKRISYFTYWLDEGLLNDGWTNSCADSNGTLYQHYYDVQKVNKWLLPIGNELFNKTSTAVFHANDESSVETNCTAYTSYGDLGNIKADNFVIGFFDDGSFMISNKYYSSETVSENLFEFTDVKNGLEYFDTDTAEWHDAEADGIVSKNGNGCLSKAFDAGEGMLFRVKK
ncbi:MAG: hypothetical protein E7623_00470 [Ruminococcaceae bacterium]|nr:hypothetical protein [Oscillospiraceae bacterium]